MAHTRIYWLHTLSPTHVGTGRGAGYIDLPIHRDKVTNWPLIPGSTFKGVWASSFNGSVEKRSTPSLRAAFGLAGVGDQTANSGSLIPTDARLVCLPIRSFKGTFAWCTSPLALQFLQRDLDMAGMKGIPNAPGNLAEGQIHTDPGTVLADNGRIYLEDLDFEQKNCGTAAAWARMLAESVFPDEAQAAWREQFQRRFAVVPNDVFDFFTETGTEVTARVKINDEQKTVQQGALWNEESLPAETILCGVIACDRVYRSKDEKGETLTEQGLLNEYASQPCTLQIGGKATIGRGRVRCVFTKVGE